MRSYISSVPCGPQVSTAIVVAEAAEHSAAGSGGTMMTVMKAGVAIAMVTASVTVKSGLRGERRGVSLDILSVCVLKGDSIFVMCQ